jgi:hypothetical protein
VCCVLDWHFVVHLLLGRAKTETRQGKTEAATTNVGKFNDQHGSTTTNANATASGTKARATVKPDRISVFACIGVIKVLSGLLSGMRKRRVKSAIVVNLAIRYSLWIFCRVLGDFK